VTTRRALLATLVGGLLVAPRATTVSDNRTRSVFDRYHIVSPGDLQEVARRLTGTIPGALTARTTEARLTRVP
jgi:hypothetical protein